jgi:hypothetical protein
VDYKAKNSDGMIVSSVGPQMAEAVAQPVLEIQSLEQELEDEQSSEGGQLLVFESQVRDGVSFALDLVSAKLHGERPPWVGVGASTTPLYQPWSRFFHKGESFFLSFSGCHSW